MYSLGDVQTVGAGGLTTWVGPLPACAPATPAASAMPIPSNERFQLFMLSSEDSTRVTTPTWPFSTASGRLQ